MEIQDLSQLTKAQIIERLLLEGVACSEKELKEELLDKLKAVVAKQVEKEAEASIKKEQETREKKEDTSEVDTPADPAPPEVIRNVFKLLTKKEQEDFCAEVFPGFMPVVVNTDNKDPYVIVNRYELFRLFQSLVSSKVNNVTGESAIKLLGRLFGIPASEYRAAKDFWVTYIRSFGRG